jgi:acyl-CoA dehydrogenase
MSDYRPPLRDMKFVLEHVAGLEAIASLPDYEHVDVDVSFTALDEAARFFADVVAPTNRTGDLIGSVRNEDGSVTTPPGFREAYAAYVEAGWGAVKGPIEYGGHGFPGAVGIAIQEMLTTANMALSLCPMLTGSAVVALLAHGTDELRAAYLEKLITGEWSGTMLLTEPAAGSDLGAVRCRAVPGDDGGWLLDGQKIFITWGEHDMVENIVHLVLARAPDGPPGTRGLSMFLVPKFLVDDAGAVGPRNGVHCVSLEHKVGIHGSPTCVMALEGAVGYLVGELHQGMQHMFSMMNDARLNVGLEGLGLSERAYQDAVAYARERRQGRAIGAPRTESSPIIDHPDVRRMLMTMKAYIEAMRALMYDNAAAIDLAEHAASSEEREAARGRAALLTPISKGWGTDLGVELTSLGIQVFGGMGYVEETGVAQHWRDARIAPIYEGTNGIQAIDLVVRKLAMDGGRIVREYLDEMQARAESAPAVIGDPLRDAVEALRTATEHLLACDDPNDALAAAAPYLRMFGTVAGGAYLARMAAAAAGDVDPWMRAKVETAAFYATQLLPQAAGLLGAVTAPAAQLFAVDAATMGS